MINITTNSCLMSKTSFGRKDSSTDIVGINTEGVGSLVMERMRKAGRKAGVGLWSIANSQAYPSMFS